MVNDWLFLSEPDKGSSGIFPMDPLLPHSSGAHWLYNVASLVDSSRYIYSRGSSVITEAFTCMSKFAGAFVIWFASGSDFNVNGKSQPDTSHALTKVNHISSVKHDLLGSFCNCKSNHRGKYHIAFVIEKMSNFALNQIYKEAERLQSFPVLALAAALVPPFTNVSSNVLAIPLEASSVESQPRMDQRPCEIENRGCAPCSDFHFQTLAWSKAVEPRTGVEFPTMLDNGTPGESNSSFTSEVLVGTGSRTMTIIRIKSLKVYAFGFYVHPFDVCEKLGRKYSCIPEDELTKCHDFYRDLLREDINMTVRLVVNCNGIKINTVKNVFEKSLRARLTRTNPHADFSCLQTFGSMFTQDIPLHVGTTINFRRTADGHLITEVGGTNIGAVQSKDLCRAFFDMYIGDVPICEQTKEEIGKNVASLFRMC